jgi:hypothetical protein
VRTATHDQVATLVEHPWFDLPVGAGADPLNYVGQHYDEVLAGTEPKNGALPFRQNPRVVDLIVTSPMGAGGGNTNSPVLDFAPVYVESVGSVANGVKMVVRFLPRDLSPGGGGGKIALIK